MSDMSYRQRRADRRQTAEERGKAPLGERLRTAILKPVDPESESASAKASPEGGSVEELEAAVRSADDKERLIGLIAAPLAALIGLLVISALITNDPAALLKDGQVNPAHTSVGLYRDLGGVLVGLSILMLVMSMLRKRLYLGIVMALYGLAIFNLHYWGFGVPFIMAGAWLLVRAYRLQRDLREANGTGPSRYAAQPKRSSSSRGSVSGRYTPATSSPKRSPSSKSVNKQQAG